VLAAAPGPAAARVLIPRDAALAQAFGTSARIRVRTVFLGEAEARRAEQAAGAALLSPRVTLYEATRGDSLLGTGYVETHRVRSMNETVLITVTPAGRVGTVEVLAFAEPDDYRAPRRWLDGLEGRALARDLRPGAALPNLGGSTLTARAIAAAVRRTLALHAAIAAGAGTGAKAAR
jgi:hypothetical protein